MWESVKIGMVSVLKSESKAETAEPEVGKVVPVAVGQPTKPIVVVPRPATI